MLHYWKSNFIQNLINSKSTAALVGSRTQQAYTSNKHWDKVLSRKPSFHRRAKCAFKTSKKIALPTGSGGASSIASSTEHGDDLPVPQQFRSPIFIFIRRYARTPTSRTEQLCEGVVVKSGDGVAGAIGIPPRKAEFGGRFWRESENRGRAREYNRWQTGIALDGQIWRERIETRQKARWRSTYVYESANAACTDEFDNSGCE